MENEEEVAGPDVGSDELTKEQVEFWWRRIRRSQKGMRERYKLWDKRLNLFKASEGGEGVPEVNVNLIPSTLAIVLNNLWTRDREVFGSTDNEELREKILPALQNRMRRLLKKLRIYRQIRRAIRDAVIFGIGFLKVGYSTENIGGGDERSDGSSVETNSSVIRGLPWVLRLSPRRVYVDQDATDLDDARWLITVNRRPLSEIQANKNYKNVSEISPESDADVKSIFHDDVRQKSFGWDDDKEEEKLVTLYEVQDKATRTTFVLAEGLKDKTVISPIHDAMPFSGFSVVEISFIEVPDEFWPLSEIGQWEGHQENLSLMRSAMMDNVQRLAMIWLARRGALSEEDRQKLIDAKSHSIVEVEDVDAIRPLPAPAMPQDFGMMEGIIQNDIRAVSGISDFERGGMVDAKTATEVTARQHASAGRGQPMRDDVTEAIGRVVDKLGVIMTTLMMREDEQPIEEGEIEWQMDAASAQAFNPSVRRKLWTDMLANMMQVEQAKPGTINIIEIVKRLLLAHDVQDVDKIVFEGVSPGSGLTPDQENLLLVAGLGVQPSEDENFEMHMRAHATIMDMPEVQQGLIDITALQAHIEATVQLAQASGVALGASVGAGAGTGAATGAGTEQGPVADSSLASSSER